MSRGSLGAAYFYHTGELASRVESEVGFVRSLRSRWKLCGQRQLSGNSVGRGSLGVAYFYHTSELTSTAKSEVGLGRSWWSGLKLCGQWQPRSRLLLPHK